MNEYEIALSAGGVIFAFCISAYIFTWLIQWAWAWLDDAKVSESNWLEEKLRFTKWKYPLHNAFGDELKEAIKSNRKPFAYAKDEKLKNKSVHGLVCDKDYKYTHNINSSIWLTTLVASLSPILFLFAFKVYPLTLAIITIVLIAFTARFARRNKKMFDSHVKDKDAHKA